MNASVSDSSTISENISSHIIYDLVRKDSDLLSIIKSQDNTSKISYTPDHIHIQCFDKYIIIPSNNQDILINPKG